MMEIWGNAVEIEKRRRILLSLWAYSYEFKNFSIVSDAEFDKESSLVDLNINTGNEEMDSWFSANFSPFTGMWIRNHPKLDRLEVLYKKHYEKLANEPKFASDITELFGE